MIVLLTYSCSLLVASFLYKLISLVIFLLIRILLQKNLYFFIFRRHSALFEIINHFFKFFNITELIFIIFYPFSFNYLLRIFVLDVNKFAVFVYFHVLRWILNLSANERWWKHKSFWILNNRIFRLLDCRIFIFNLKIWLTFLLYLNYLWFFPISWYLAISLDLIRLLFFIYSFTKCQIFSFLLVIIELFDKRNDYFIFSYYILQVLFINNCLF